MQIFSKDINDLLPYVNNARKHSEDQINQIASSIKEFGFTLPILIDNENMIMAGHGRVLAAKKLGIKNVPCVVSSNLSKTQKKAYIIADNKLALNSSWDFDLLKIELETLNEDSYDFDKIFFDSTEISSILGLEDTEEAVTKSEKYKAVFEVIIECNNESQQEDLFNRFQSEGFKCRILSM